MHTTTELTPFARRVVAMRNDGHSVESIATAFRRSPDHILRVLSWSEMPRTGVPGRRRYPKAFERRVLAMRASGNDYPDIAGRFNASPEFIRRVEGMAHLRIAHEILGGGGAAA